MKSGARRAIGFVLLLSLGVVGLRLPWLLHQRRTERSPTVTLGHPRIGVKVLKVSTGTNHQLTVGLWPFLNPLRQRIPQLRPFLGEPTDQAQVQGFVTNLTVFFEPQDTSRGFESDRIFDGLFRVRPVDSHGCLLAGFSIPHPYPLRQRLVRVAEMSPYPRRDRSFGIEFQFAPNVGVDGRMPDVVMGPGVTTVERSAGSSSNRIRVVNPSPWSGKEWVPEALPAVREDGELRVEVHGWEGTPESPVPNVRYVEAGKVGAGWEQRWSTLSDVTGNTGSAWELCRFEPAWRWTLGVIRTPESVVDPSSTGIWPSGPRPVSATAVEVGQGVEVLGVPVMLVAHGGPGAFRFERRAEWQWAGEAGFRFQGVPEYPRLEGGLGPQGHWAEYQSAHSWIALQHGRVDGALAFSIAAVDPAGRFHPGLPGLSPDGRLWIYEVPMPSDVTQVGWKVVVQPVRYFEFTLPPPPPLPGTRGPAARR